MIKEGRVNTLRHRWTVHFFLGGGGAAQLHEIVQML